MTDKTVSLLYFATGIGVLLIMSALGFLDHSTRGTIIVFFAIVPIFFAAFGYLVLSDEQRRPAIITLLSALGVLFFLGSAVCASTGFVRGSDGRFAVMMSLNVASMLCCAVVFIAKFLQLHRKIKEGARLPLYTWSLFLTAIFLLPGFTFLEFAAIRQTRRGWSSEATSFALESPGNPWRHHFFWFVGHPEVLVMAFFFLGLVTELARRAIWREGVSR